MRRVVETGEKCMENIVYREFTTNILLHIASQIKNCVCVYVIDCNFPLNFPIWYAYSLSGVFKAIASIHDIMII